MAARTAGEAEEEDREVRVREDRSGADFREGRLKSFPAVSMMLPLREGEGEAGAVLRVARVLEREMVPSPG